MAYSGRALKSPSLVRQKKYVCSPYFISDTMYTFCSTPVSTVTSESLSNVSTPTQPEVIHVKDDPDSEAEKFQVYIEESVFLIV